MPLTYGGVNRYIALSLPTRQPESESDSKTTTIRPPSNTMYQIQIPLISTSISISNETPTVLSKFCQIFQHEGPSKAIYCTKQQKFDCQALSYTWGT